LGDELPALWHRPLRRNTSAVEWYVGSGLLMHVAAKIKAFF
jgi:hypothetical protein